MTGKANIPLVILCAVFCLFTSCQSEKPSAEITEAMEVHRQIMTLEEEVEQQFVAKKAALEASPKQEQWQALQTRYEEWKASLVEVPGMEHDHHGHDHGHDHDHGHQELQLTDAQMLEVQKSLYQELENIQQALQAL